jgi:hypothetical protein
MRHDTEKRFRNLPSGRTAALLPTVRRPRTARAAWFGAVPLQTTDNAPCSVGRHRHSAHPPAGGERWWYLGTLFDFSPISTIIIHVGRSRSKTSPRFAAMLTPDQRNGDWFCFSSRNSKLTAASPAPLLIYFTDDYGREMHKSQNQSQVGRTPNKTYH